MNPIVLMKREPAFNFVVVACGAFVALTVVAMFIYPGSTITNDATQGYSFFENFFSDLGMTTTYGGTPNPIASALFFVALTLAGCAVIVFFSAFLRFFQTSPIQRWLSRVASVAGVLAGACLIGVAFTPANLSLDAHVQFVLWAFRLLPLAVLLYAVIIFRDPHYPHALGYIFVGYGLLLVGYIGLLEFGPDIHTYTGMVVQAVGQKIIVYASIISVGAQAGGAQR